MASLSTIVQTLAERQVASSGGWSYLGSFQISLEATCLAAVASDPQLPAASAAGIRALLRLQRHDGSWPAFAGDSAGSWTTSLALCALNQRTEFATARDKALRWLLEERGKECHWLWRWKFKTTDRNGRRIQNNATFATALLALQCGEMIHPFMVFA